MKVKSSLVERRRLPFLWIRDFEGKLHLIARRKRRRNESSATYKLLFQIIDSIFRFVFVTELSLQMIRELVE
ncbi:hypothetical protein L6452_21555 [Arctium lappa]|uniref:Uncharacterized protein n=1 Tax=Arctium lappa TaxID=4217 RepID=A0ACB9AXQ6_ARCLA|nr:hypothetical protein L6452_21555 [Arctium lappa]